MLLTILVILLIVMLLGGVPVHRYWGDDGVGSLVLFVLLVALIVMLAGVR